MPAPLQVTYTSYATSKLALVKLVEILQHENPDMRIVSIHPGLIATEMFAKSEMQGLPIDDGKWRFISSYQRPLSSLFPHYACCNVGNVRNAAANLLPS